MKNNPRFLFAVAILALSVFMTACHKEHASGNSTSTTVNLITQSPWIFETSGLDLNKDGTIDYVDTTVTSCFKDNTYLFNKDSTGVMDEGATKCNASDPQTVDFTWSVSGTNPQVIKANVNSLLANGIKIYSISSAEFKLYKDTTYLGVSLYYIVSLKHVN